MRWQDHIVATADTLHRQARFRDTRIAVSVVLDNLAAGITREELHAEYPTLPAEAVPAALAYPPNSPAIASFPFRRRRDGDQAHENVADSVGAILPGNTINVPA